MTTDPHTTTPAQRPLRTVKGAAERLNVSTRTVRRLIDAGELAAIWFGRSLRIDDDDLDAFIGRHRKHVIKCPLVSIMFSVLFCLSYYYYL